MYSGVDGGFIGSFSLFEVADPAMESAEGGYAGASDWFFQMVFVATAASIVSGAVAERVKLMSFLAIVVVLTAIIYPIQGSGPGCRLVIEMSFSDFAGSTIVHPLVDGALAGCIVLELEKYGTDGKVTLCSLSITSCYIRYIFTVVWLVWFSRGSQLALGSVADASSMARIFAILI